MFIPPKDEPAVFIPNVFTAAYNDRNAVLSTGIAFRKENGKYNNSALDNMDIDELSEFKNIPVSGVKFECADTDKQYAPKIREGAALIDPRGFEVCINPNAVSYLISNCTIHSGIIEDEIVYGWEGAYVVPVPVTASDYNKHTEYSNKRMNHTAIYEDDLIIGAVYRTVLNREMMYLGRFESCKYEYRWTEHGKIKKSSKKSGIPPKIRDIKGYDEHVVSNGEELFFACPVPKENIDLNDTNNERRSGYFSYDWRLIPITDLDETQLIECVSTEKDPLYDDAVACLLHNTSLFPYDDSKDQRIAYTKEQFMSICEKLRTHTTGTDPNKRYVYSGSRELDQDEKYYIDYANSQNIYNVEIMNMGGDHVKINILDTPEELYEWLHPEYIQQYLFSGVPFQKNGMLAETLEILDVT